MDCSDINPKCHDVIAITVPRHTDITFYSRDGFHKHYHYKDDIIPYVEAVQKLVSYANVILKSDPNIHRVVFCFTNGDDPIIIFYTSPTVNVF